MRDDTTAAIGIAFIFAVLFASYAMKAAKCDAVASAMKTRGSYGILTGCMIEHDGAMIPLENLRVVQ
jgi:hypothetical protein